MNHGILLIICTACGLIGSAESLHSAGDLKNRTLSFQEESVPDISYSSSSGIKTQSRNGTITSPSDKPTVDISKPENLPALYANHFSLQSERSELIIDLGVISVNRKKGLRRFDIQKRMALNYYTAKRMLAALEVALNRHEQVFGMLKPNEPNKSVESETHPAVVYANFARISSTPEELILDFGLNRHPFAQGRVKIVVSHTIVMLHPTAKRLYVAIRKVIEDYEKKHGVIETDIQKRVVPKYDSAK